MAHVGVEPEIGIDSVAVFCLDSQGSRKILGFSSDPKHACRKSDTCELVVYMAVLGHGRAVVVIAQILDAGLGLFSVARRARWAPVAQWTGVAAGGGLRGLRGSLPVA